MADAVGSIDTPDAQDEVPEAQKKTRKGGKRAKKGPLKRLGIFYRQIVAELRKVVWPTRNEALQMTGYVFLFVFVMALFLFLTDKTLEWVLYDLILGWKR
jgi:preprotein translocase subunit SecE